MKTLILVMAIVLGNDSGSRFTFLEKRLPESFQGATITGTVVDARTMRPLRGAVVTAPQEGGGKLGTQRNVGFRTGADGKFVLRNVAPGVVSFRVYKAGYATAPISSVRPATGGERIDNVVLTVPPGASISGRITDETGQPLISLTVTVRGAETTSVLGNSNRPNIAQPNGGIVFTDTEGRYSIGGLSAGEYSVSVSFPAGMAPAILRINSDRDVVFNGFGRQTAASLQSATVKLDAAEERTLDLVTRLPETETVFGPAGEEPGTGLVSGSVVDPRGRGIPNASLTLVRGDPTALLKAVTDASGRFVFENVPSGSFQLTTQKAGYMPVAGPAQPKLVIDSKTRIEDLKLTLQRGATISGTITDEFGDPLAAAVMAINPGTVVIENPGIRSFGRGGATDARGRFQIGGLTAGEYMLMAAPTGAFVGATAIHHQDARGQDSKLTLAPVFHPGVTTQTFASKIVLREGDDLANFDFVVEPAAVATVNVAVTANQPTSAIQIQWVQLGQLIPMLAGSMTATGTTTTLEAIPARYRFVASSETLAEKATRLWASVDLEPDVDVPASIQLALEPGARLSGRIVFEGNDPDRQDAGAWLVPTEPLPGLKIDGNSTFEPASGRFAIEGVLPGRYALYAGGAERNRSPWMLKSAIVDGREVMDDAIALGPGQEIADVRLTVTDRVTELSGKILDAAQKPAAAGWVLVFSTEKKHWVAGSRRLRAVTPEMTSTYTVRAIPPGTYFVTLLPELMNEEDLIAKLPSLVSAATRVTLGEGERKVQDLRAR